MRGGRERSGVLSKAKTGFDEESLDQILEEYMKSSDAKASECRLKFSSKMSIFIRHLYLCSVISL